MPRPSPGTCVQAASSRASPSRQVERVAQLNVGRRLWVKPLLRPRGVQSPNVARARPQRPPAAQPPSSTSVRHGDPSRAVSDCASEQQPLRHHVRREPPRAVPSTRLSALSMDEISGRVAIHMHPVSSESIGVSIERALARRDTLVPREPASRFPSSAGRDRHPRLRTSALKLDGYARDCARRRDSACASPSAQGRSGA